MLVEGTYTDEEIFLVHAIGHPPCEKRADTRQLLLPCTLDLLSDKSARAIYGHIDFLGKGATTVLEDVVKLHLLYRCQKLISITQNRLADQLSEHTQLTFFILSDLWLDHPRTMIGIRKLFHSCIESNWLPKVFIMCGDFSSKGVVKGSGRDIIQYQGQLLLDRL